MCREKRKANNSGMTLVELLVAIVILAAILTPLLHVFVSSARTNQNAKRNLSNTTVVQDIMEGIKAETIETLAYGFVYPDGLVLHPGTVQETIVTDGFHLVDRSLVDGGSALGMFEARATVVESVVGGTPSRTISNLIEATLPVYSGKTVLENGTRRSIGNYDADHYVFEPQTDSKYYFVIRNMNIEKPASGVPSQVVDVMIQVDGSNYTQAGTSPKSSILGGDEALLNDYNLANIQSTEPALDAFFRQDENMAVNAAMIIAAQKGLIENELSVSDIRQEITLTTKRITPGEPDYRGHDNKDQLEVYLTITYTTGLGSAQDSYSPVRDQMIFSNRGTGEELRNIYLCYYPLYDGNASDAIYYKNEGNTDAVLHLVKQEPSDNTHLNVDEYNYHCDVYLEDLHVTADKFGLRTNLDRNMYEIYLAGAMPADNQARYHYNGVTISKNSLNMLHDLAGKEGTTPYREDRIFDVTIDVFQNGTVDTLLGGGSISSSDDAFLFSVKGSMN